MQNNSIPQSAQEKQTFYKHHVDQQIKSGLSLSAYSKQHNIKPNTLWSWKKKYRPETIDQAKPKLATPSSQPASFVTIPALSSAVSTPLIQCKLPNGIEISWPVATQPEHIAQLIQAVSA